MNIYKKILMISVCLVMAFSAVPAFAATLQFVDKGNGVVDITVDDSSNILGAAFTVQYDSTKLNEPTVESSYFDTFSSQGYATEDGLDANGMVEGYDSPLVANSATGAIKIAAARHTADSANTTLFTLSFTAAAGATPGSSTTITLVPTEMTADVGGWNVGDKVDPLVGVSGDSFSVELYAATLESDSVTADITVPDGGGEDVTVSISLFEGWNLVSIPVIPTNSNVSFLFPDASVVWQLTSTGYKQPTELEPGYGYWIKVPADKIYNITGSKVTQFQIPLIAGWNLVGASYGTSMPTTDPTDQITTMWGLGQSGYFSPSTFSQGLGYWVKVAQNVALTVNTQ